MHKAQQNTTPFGDHLCLWIEAEWEDRGGPELVRDLVALGLADGRDVLPVEAGIAWYCEISRNNQKIINSAHFKNIQVYLSLSYTTIL